MTKPADVTSFPPKPRLCPHGQPMERHERFSAPAYYEARDCDACKAAKDDELDREEAEAEAWLERRRARSDYE